MNRAIVLTLVLGLMTILAISGRWMMAIGGTGTVLGAVMLYQLVRQRSQYLASGLGLMWLGIGLAGLVLFLWAWF